MVVHCLESTEDSLTITWDPVEGATQEKYEVQWRVEGTGEEFAPLGSKGFTNRDPKRKGKLASGTAYEFRVRGRDNVDWLSWSDPTSHATLPEAACRLPAPTMQSSDAGAITVQWTDVPGAAAYELQFRGVDDCSWRTLSNKVGHVRTRTRTRT